MSEQHDINEDLWRAIGALRDEVQRLKDGLRQLQRDYAYDIINLDGKIDNVEHEVWRMNR